MKQTKKTIFFISFNHKDKIYNNNINKKNN